MRRHNVLLDIACGTEARDYNYSREVFSHKLQVSVQKKRRKKMRRHPIGRFMKTTHILRFMLSLVTKPS